MKTHANGILFTLFLGMLLLIQFGSTIGCKKDEPGKNDTVVTPPTVVKDSVMPSYPDDYAQYAALSSSGYWGPYNLHDPSIIKYQNYYYIYSTDVAYGGTGKCGIMFRKSKDLVNWTFVGWVFNGVPPKALEFMESHQPGYRQLSIWAPYIIKVDDKFRLYYSVPGNDIHLACIGLATSSYPDGPWTDEGIVLSCIPGDLYNAIDPSVTIDAVTGKHWMTYGSYDDGIFMVELDPLTGKRFNGSDLGKRIAMRTNRHDAIEGSEIIYNSEQKMYYLFVSYDWLEDNYNVRVGRSANPDGPYLDFNGNDMAAPGDNTPMITAQYQFNNHSGWQGLGHCGLLHEGDNYYYVSQARLGSDKYFMDLHIHRMIWTPAGWPVISPERYVYVPQPTITTDDIIGKWEHIDLVNTASKNHSINIELLSNGTISGVDASTWSFADGWMTLKFNNESTLYKVKVFSEWDWENKRKTIVYTGNSTTGQSGWGKKIPG
jgi:arabinan endo-1,5-alpha-L-arabinosidase